MNSKIQSSPATGLVQDPGYPRQTTPQEALSQPERMAGKTPYEINPNEPKTGNNPHEIDPQPMKSPDEISPNTPRRENTPNEINPNSPQTNNPNEITPNSPQPAGEYEDDTRQQSELQLSEKEAEKKDGYAEQPSEEYIPEINGNEKYQLNYQDNEEPGIIE